MLAHKIKAPLILLMISILLAFIVLVINNNKKIIIAISSSEPECNPIPAEIFLTSVFTSDDPFFTLDIRSNGFIQMLGKICGCLFHFVFFTTRWTLDNSFLACMRSLLDNTISE